MRTSTRLERTIARPASVEGISFLSGLDVRLTFRPADPGTGLCFLRGDLPGRPTVPAHVRFVQARQRRTTLRHGEAIVEMVEHVLAALAGLRIDNCTIEIDGPETPGCDGSSQAFVEALLEAGIVEQDRPRDVLVIERPLTVREGCSALTAHPGAGDHLVLSYNLDYGPDAPICPQSRFVSVCPRSFQTELAASRTFLLESEADALRRAGIGSRTTEADLLIFGADGPINNSLRFADECARHKLLDMVGDLALLGKDLVGHVVAHRSGHQLNAELVRELLKAAASGSGPSLASSDPTSLDINEILKLLPHRYPFLLIDRIVEFESGRRAVAIKNVSINEPFFQGHWPGRPIMPGVLVLESIAQAAGVLIGEQMDSTSQMILIASIDDVKLRRSVLPGDQLRIEVEHSRSRARAMDYRGVARVGEQVAAEARFRFVLVATEQAA